YHIASGKTTKLTNGKISFADETNDKPDYPNAYGLAGWTNNDEAVLIYDRYDIWSYDPQGRRAPVNLTKNGRQERLTYRYINLDPEKRTIGPADDLLLSVVNETTRAAGYYKLSLKDNKLTRLLYS